MVWKSLLHTCQSHVPSVGSRVADVALDAAVWMFELLLMLMLTLAV